MVIVAALVLAASAPAAQASAPPAPVAAERQAVAMVRILPGAMVRFAELERSTPESFTDSRIRGEDGSLQPARLVEFQ